MKNNNRFIAGGLILAAFAVAIFLSRDLISLHFPELGHILNAGLVPSKQQQADLAIQQQESLVAAEETIAAAEQLSAETVLVQSEPTPFPDKEAKPWTLHAVDSDLAPSIKLNPKVKVYSPVTLEPHPDRLPAAGDQIILPMFDGKSVKVNVESAESNSNGDYIWSGHLDGHNNDYPVVMTYGENTTFATITTPEGSYSLEAVKGTGWLYKNPAEAELSAQGKNDFLIPEIHPDIH